MLKTVSRRSILTCMAGAAAGGLAAPHVARAAARTIRLGQNNTDESHYGQGSSAFAQAVADHPTLSGSIKIQVYGNGSLGDELGMLKGCASGALDIVLCSNSTVNNIVPEFGILDTPFLFKDIARARAALDGPIGAEIAETAKAKGLTLLSWSENGMRHITANTPIRTPSDLKGIKIRVPESKVIMGGFLALGAAPAPLNFRQLRDALRAGQFDAQENPVVVIESAGLNDFQKYLSVTGHIYSPAVFFGSADLMEDLTEAQQQALFDCAKKGSAVTRDVAAAAQTDGIARLRAAGMTVLDDVDVASFQAASRPYLDSLAVTFGADLMTRLVGA